MENEASKGNTSQIRKYFEGNCKQKLNDIGIKERNKQKFFLEKVFGIMNKSHRIAEDKQELESKVQNVDEDLHENAKTWRLHSEVFKVPRRQARNDRPNHDPKGKMQGSYVSWQGWKTYTKPYTNLSESMNNTLSKIDFTKDKC